MFGLFKLLKAPQKMMKTALSALDHPYVLNFLKLFLVVYAGAIAPKLPGYVLRLFDHQLVKLAVFGLIVYTGTKDPTLSLLVAIAFNVTLVTLAKLETTSDIGAVINALVDGPQKLVNDVIDTSQELLGAGVDKLESTLAPVVDVSPVTGRAVSLVDAVVDGVQDVGNAVIDGAQGVVESTVGKVVDMASSMSLPMPEMEGFTDEIQGFDGGEYGAAF